MLGLFCQLCLDFLANVLGLGLFFQPFHFLCTHRWDFRAIVGLALLALGSAHSTAARPACSFGETSGSNFVTALARLLAQREEGAVHGGPVDAGVLMPAAAVTAGLVYIAARADLLLHLCEEETLQSLTTVVYRHFVYRHFEFPEPVSKQCTWLASNWRWTKLLTC